MLGLQHHDRNTRVEEIHRDPPAHRACANDRYFVDRADDGVFGNIGDFAGCPLGKEGMAQRLALRGLHQLNKQFALDGEACIDLSADRGGHCIDTTQGSREILRHRTDGVSGELKIGIRIGMSTFQIANQREWPGRRNFVGEGNRAFHQVACDHAVEQLLSGQTREQFALDWLAAHDHVECGLDPENARQALGATGTGEQAQLDFRQRNAGAGRGDPIVTTQCELQPAAHADAMDRGNDGLGGSFTDADQTAQVGLSQRHRRAKFFNVGTARKRLACAGDHDRVNRRISVRLLDSVGDIPSGCIT